MKTKNLVFLVLFSIAMLILPSKSVASPGVVVEVLCRVGGELQPVVLRFVTSCEGAAAYCARWLSGHPSVTVIGTTVVGAAVCRGDTGSNPVENKPQKGRTDGHGDVVLVD